jgi:hypothetical protein
LHFSKDIDRELAGNEWFIEAIGSFLVEELKPILARDRWIKRFRISSDES